MSTYRQTLRIALAGVQGPLPESIVTHAAEWGAPATPSQALMQAATVLAQAERCARRLPRHVGPPTAAAPAESLSPAVDDVVPLLAQGLDEPNAWVMRDKSELLVARKEYLPHALLPQWLDFAAKNADERDVVLACTGQRGRWLAALNPEWQALLGPVADATAWETGTLAQRLDALGAMRRGDPDAGRVALEAVWSQEPPEAREKLLECLAIGLCPADEALLETARADKRKEVRRVALDLLCRLPGAAFSQRQLARLGTWLSCTPARLLRSPKLDVVLPEHYDKTWALDGIPEKSTRQSDNIGDKANWLAESLGYVPLQPVLDRLGLTIDQWTAILGKHEYAAALWAGSVLSFERHPDPALLSGLLAVPHHGLKSRLLQKSLAMIRNGGPLDAWLGPWLPAAEIDWLAAHSLPRLDERHSRVAFQHVRAHVDARRGQHGGWAMILPSFSERLHARVLPDWLAWLDSLGNEPYAGKAVDAAVTIAALRHRLFTFHPSSKKP